MKKYRLLKEMPGLPKEALILLHEDGKVTTTTGTDLHKTGEIIGEMITSWCQIDDWFEEVKEEEKIELGIYERELFGCKLYQVETLPYSDRSKAEQIKSQIEQALEERMSVEELELIISVFNQIDKSKPEREQYKKLEQILAKRKGGRE